MKDSEDDEELGAGWNTKEAAALLGKYVIAAFIHVLPDGTVRERSQVHGVIVDAEPSTGFVLSLRGKRLGETMTLPPNASAFIRADSGNYRLKSTNELVIDPDYTSLWTVTEQLIH